MVANADIPLSCEKWCICGWYLEEKMQVNPSNRDLEGTCTNDEELREEDFVDGISFELLFLCVRWELTFTNSFAC